MPENCVRPFQCQRQMRRDATSKPCAALISPVLLVHKCAQAQSSLSLATKYLSGAALQHFGCYPCCSQRRLWVLPTVASTSLGWPHFGGSLHSRSLAEHLLHLPAGSSATRSCPGVDDGQSSKTAPVMHFCFSTSGHQRKHGIISAVFVEWAPYIDGDAG